MMQPSSSTRATIVSAENQNDATIVKDKFFFCHYYIVWESNNTGDARGQSWNESLKSIWIPEGSCGYTSGTKRKHFAALSSPRPWWRWLQLQATIVRFPPVMTGSDNGLSPSRRHAIIGTNVDLLLITGLGFFRPKPVSSGQNGKNWIKPVLSSFFRPKPTKTGRNQGSTLRVVRSSNPT